MSVSVDIQVDQDARCVTGPYRSVEAATRPAGTSKIRFGRYGAKVDKGIPLWMDILGDFWL